MLPKQMLALWLVRWNWYQHRAALIAVTRTCRIINATLRTEGHNDAPLRDAIRLSPQVYHFYHHDDPHH
jgi:hypothetical protein